MSNVAKLKKKAAEFELKKQFDKALAVYVELLEQFDQHADELDVALFNRAGDILLRQGNVADAVDYYERGIDRYAEGGFFNNAIALCNKVLRHSPGRSSVYYKLGKISAKKGFSSDAKQNFLEYAARMQKSGNMDEAFRALKEFADLCPDQADIRLMLAEQLSKVNRKPEAVEQLQLLHERYLAEGQDREAAATLARMKAIDPTAEARDRDSGARKQSSGDLVFLDLDDAPRRTPLASPTVPRPSDLSTRPTVPTAKPPEPRAPSQPVPPAPAAPAAPAAPPPAAPAPAAQLSVEPSLPGDNMSFATPSFGTPAFDAPAIGGAGDPPVDASLDSGPPLGLEPTGLEDGAAASDVGSGSLLDLEPTSLTPIAPSAAIKPRSEPPLSDWTGGPSSRTPIFGSDALGGLPLIGTPEAAPPPPRRPSRTPLADLEPPLLRPEPAAVAEDPPLMELEVPETAPPAGRGGTRELPEMTLLEEPFSVPPAAEEVDESDADDIEPDPAVVAPRSSTMFAAQSVDVLRAAVTESPNDWTLRRDLAEAMLEAGDRDGGLRELDAAMMGAERGGDLDTAYAIATEIGRVDPGSVRHHQKRVEYAFRVNDKPRLVEAYLSLGEALVGVDQAEKARAVYQRVLDIAPDDIRAQGALEAIAPPERPAAAPPTPSRPAATQARPPADVRPAARPIAIDSDFINLGDFLRADEGPKDTRMVVDEQEPTGDEDADFQDMLRKFKQGVAANIEEEDTEAHYDLGVAYKEMGLLDEAISEFQKALRAPENRVRTYEALGQCFIDKALYPMAYTVLSRALNEKGMTDDKLVGVLYLMGRAAEAQNKRSEAASLYQRVFVVDIQFRDVAERLAAVENAG